jgi:hypothetical protein
MINIISNRRVNKFLQLLWYGTLLIKIKCALTFIKEHMRKTIVAVPVLSTVTINIFNNAKSFFLSMKQ